ncbi:MFS transporter [Paenibacillus sp. KQZ6P-2]|uniref:MFS transporter n=1 Tax=Paenibacillus mangrovi TaxID=2931978 RepID=A0A9X1WSQ4_9BACL|nr:MFS transporter [Paenibacillus mangrovi]MCJ8012830.1 MFS transporter [Paenibacillus mangrovi]
MCNVQDTVKKQSRLLPLKAFNFLIYGTMVIFTSFFQLYLQDAGMNKQEIGSLIALGPLVSLIANPFWRFWSDRLHNARRILLFMMTGTLLLIQIIFHVSTYNMMYLAMILFFFFQSPLFAQSNTLILGYIADTPQKFGTFRNWGSIGWAIVAVTAGLLIDRIGISHLSFLVTGILLLAIGTILMLPPLRAASETPPIRLRGFGKFAINRYFVAFILLGILVSVPNAMNNTFLSLYITELGGSKTMVGFAVFLSSILEVAVLVLFHRYLKRSLSTLIGCLAVVSVLFCIRWLLMADATQPLQVAFIQIMHCITFGGYFYVGTQVVSLLVPPVHRASAHSLFTLTWGGLSTMVGSLAGGWLFQNFGGQAMYNTAFLLAMFGAIGFGLMWYWLRIQGHHPKPDSPEDDELDDQLEEYH